jgi:hypothetical protein
MSVPEDLPNEDCASPLGLGDDASPRGRRTFEARGELGSSLPPSSFVVRYCEICKTPFQAKRSDKLTCSIRCRKEKSRRKLDPERAQRRVQPWRARRSLALRKGASPPGYKGGEGLGSHAGPWQDKTLRAYITPDGLRRQAFRSVYHLWYQAGVRRLPPLYAGLLHRPYIDCLGPAVRQGLRGRKKVRRKVVVELGRATHELQKKLAVYTERERMLNQELQQVTERMAETADRLDEGFRLSQKEWLQMKAERATQARLILELLPATSQYAGLRSAAESILTLNTD